MAEVSFNSTSPYQQQMSALERRQRMAEALQQQSYMPIERHSYNGIEAPISPAAGLAKMLEGFAPAMEQREIENKRGELVAGARKEGADWLTDLSQSEVPMPAGEQGPPRPKTEPEKLAHLLKGLQLDDPSAAGLAGSLYAKEIAPPELKFIPEGGTGVLVRNGRQVGQIDTGPQMPFRGTSIEAQDSNILLKNDPASPEYAAAYNRQREPKTFIDQSSGQVVTRTPDMSAYRVPGGAKDGMGPAGSLSATPTPGAMPGTAADRSKLKLVEVEADTLLDSIDRFADIVKDATDTDFLSAVTGGTTGGGAKLNTAWTNAALMAKGEALFNLGVLNGPDLNIIQSALPNPSTLKGSVTSKAAYAASINEISRLINTRVRAYKAKYGTAPATEAAPKAAKDTTDTDAAFSALRKKYGLE